AVARDKNLLHVDEAKELQRVVTEGSLGAQTLSTGDIAMTAVIARPKPAAELCAEDVYEVRLIDAPPSSLHPPSQFAAAA
ncbi:hypothetical protein NL533_35545, partial [Klebsiella pneumoniae]|nr:hypothetical protein [Klebsiella pneumoniae]